MDLQGYESCKRADAEAEAHLFRIHLQLMRIANFLVVC